MIRGELWEKGPHLIPACVDCHQVHYGARQTSLLAESRYNQPLTENAGTKKAQPELCLTCQRVDSVRVQDDGNAQGGQELMDELLRGWMRPQAGADGHGADGHRADGYRSLGHRADSVGSR